ncbi:hypothetical protein BABINDRAFT_35995 [Babjeviella inositovora NRRL Y-12698]|uniref:Proline dehydrogenase n=1 Tax=Babjeviella inositovora NRRL Y-12698 TaxID=984486 RepID=A0A1E3QR78_9ASCO|nr:uncharacterized protein BABINDRAFT_35995 [Babjeviella inositovora NRRL Y-12698]ODQ80203.1 hypothetical protein BABINDRAFT_35995 [Babjeviella inositovora NRRL Y-12698]
MQTTRLAYTTARAIPRGRLGLHNSPLVFGTRSLQQASNRGIHTKPAAKAVATSIPKQDVVSDDPNAYLATLKTSELLSYSIIGMATLTKPILNLVIKLFPYVPMWAIKGLVYKTYCGGETISDVIATGQRLHQRNINNMMISLTIEGCDGDTGFEALYIVDETKKSVTDILVPHMVKMLSEAAPSEINSIPAGYVALKPTGLVKDAANVLRHFDQPSHSARFEELVANSAAIIDIIYKKNVELSKAYPERVSPFVVGVIDAERFELQEGVYELQRRLYSKYNPVNKPVSVVGTIQMYLKNSMEILTKDMAIAEKENFRVGVKLVRGAYIHSEPDRNVIHNTKEDTDKNYDAGIALAIDQILTNKNKQASTIGHLVVASHNGDSQLKATELIKSYSTTDSLTSVQSQSQQSGNIALAQLMGMADNVTYDLINKHGVKNLIKYVAWGPAPQTKEYLLRRLEENGDAMRADSGWGLLKGCLQVLGKRAF